MAEPFSPASPGDVEWLPGPGGARALRIDPAAADPPTLILRLAGGAERRIEASAAEFVIPTELDWTAAWLQWPDGTRAALPLPHGPHAEVIQLHPRRFARTDATPRSTAAPPAAGSPPDAPVASRLDAPGAADASLDGAAPSWTTPPQLSDSTQEAEAAWRERRDELRRELAESRRRDRPRPRR